MDLGLKGQVAVVIGAASGIGLATTRAFLAEGVSVVGADIEPEVDSVIEPLATEGSASGVSASGMCLDATDFAAVTRLADSVWTQHGRCDHVVAAIGCSSGSYGFPFWNLTPQVWSRVLEVNLIAVASIAHAFAPRMADAGVGTFCFLSSVAGQIGSQTDPPYSAAKAGVINFGQCAAKDLAPYGVRVNIVSPGMVATPLNRSVWNAWRAASPDHRLSYEDWGNQKVKQVAPLGQWQQPEEIAAVIAFLASHHARNITGQTINVDGGQCMHS